MPTFTGIDLRMVFDSGVNEVDTQKDIYSRWKDFVLSGLNATWPPAFDIVSSATITSALESAPYFIFRNDLGWRMRPPEEDITITLTGNLIPASADLPMIVPTLGGFSVLILGIQPVSQNVDPVLLAVLDLVTLLQGRMETDPATGIMTVYDATDTARFQGNIYEDVLAATLYNTLSTRIDRRNRLVKLP